ncbi:unannotated protein [freshwater metagenome]|uniref:Unannotated protein n=1 Tax=freshwater metagenome TaxID=449393 RepID=A0A6J5YUI9_9ZZZZ
MTRMTMSAALVRWLTAQYVDIDGVEKLYFPGAYAIFGHGNALAFGDELEPLRASWPTYRGQNEQGMALAAVAYAKAARREQCMVVATSIGPGALNVVTAAGVAMANRLPMLVLAGDTFHSRAADPVLQQIEHFNSPSTTVNDAFRPVTRYWDRITHPGQLLSSLPQMISTLLDAADCGPAFLGLPQDVQAQAFDYPDEFFARTVHRQLRPRADETSIANAAHVIRAAKHPVIISGGGVRYSRAHQELSAFAQSVGIPVVETVAGKATLVADDPMWSGPIGVTGADQTNDLVAQADVVIAVGTRLQDFTTGSWTVFNPDATFIGVNAARFDAVKHRSIPVVGDARETLIALGAALAGHHTTDDWQALGRASAQRLREAIQVRTDRPLDGGLPSYAQVVAAVHRVAGPRDYVLTAAGGLPGELNINWLSKGRDTFDCEYGFSCMGYEIAGAWGAAMQLKERGDGGVVFAMTGDGSYLMLNSEIYAAVLNKDHLVLVICDNGGFAVINRLQEGHGAASFRTMLQEKDQPEPFRVDFRAHAQSLGATAVQVESVAEFEQALAAAKAGEGVQVVVINTHPKMWTEGSTFWEVGIPEVTSRDAVKQAREELLINKKNQRW